MTSDVCDFCLFPPTSTLQDIVLHSDKLPTPDHRCTGKPRVTVSRLHTVPRAPRADVCPNKTMTYENFQNLGSEGKNQETGKAAPPQSFLWNVFSWTHLLLFSLGLGFLLLVVVSVIGSQNSQIRRDLRTLRANSENLTSYTQAELQALNSRGDSLQERINSLKVDVDDHRQELLAGRDLSQKVTSLESTMEKKEQALKTDLSEMTERVQQLGKDLKALSCQLASLRNNGSEMTCCPLHWIEHEGSCYWFSQTGKSWPEADKYCQLENAHLVVVNSMEEQVWPRWALLEVVCQREKSFLPPFFLLRNLSMTARAPCPPGWASQTKTDPGDGWMGLTLTMASRIGSHCSQIIGMDTGWEEVRTVPTSLVTMVVGMMMSARGFTTGFVKQS